MGLALAGIPHQKGGVTAALEYLAEQGQTAVIGRASDGQRVGSF